MAATARKQSYRTTSVNIGPPDPHSFEKFGFKLSQILSRAQYSAPPNEYIMIHMYEIFRRFCTYNVTRSLVDRFRVVWQVGRRPPLLLPVSPCQDQGLDFHYQGQGQELHVQGQGQGHCFFKDFSRTSADSMFHYLLHRFI